MRIATPVRQQGEDASSMSHAMLAIATYLATTGVVEGLGPSKMVQTRKPFAGVNATDVVAVMAMGDSWMTGFNAPGYSRPFELQKVSNDYRGGAWTTGDGIVAPGARPVETLATLLRRYNPALAGVSSGMTPMREPCVVKPRECGLNAAVDGATLPTDGEPGQRAHPNTLLQQAVDLCQWVRTRYPPAVQEGWKVLTVLASWGDQFWTPRNARKQGEELRRALEKLRADMPGRTYVNILAFSEHPSSLTRCARAPTAPGARCARDPGPAERPAPCPPPAPSAPAACTSSRDGASSR